jgi:hypothetical protein
MSSTEALAFGVTLLALMILSAAGLLLIGAMTIFLTATIGFIAGRGQMPWLTFTAIILAFIFLHAGKSKMRAKYWTEEESAPLSLFGLPSFFGEWSSYSMERGVLGLFRPAEEGEDSSESLLQRSTLMRLLLYEIAVCPDEVPYLEGATYGVIPELLIPRIFNEEKLWSHEGTYMLNIHFGIQTFEQTRATTIGWGLLNEGYANFGITGVAILGCLLGFFYGRMERITAAAPLFSLRCFTGVIVLVCAFQTEFSAGVYVSSLFQSLCVVGVLSFLFMRRQSAGELLPSIRPSDLIPAAARFDKLADRVGG